MKITYNNYLEKIGSVDWSKTNDTLRRAKDEMNEFHELYNDDDTIKETFDLFLKQLNEVLAKVDVKPTEKKLPKPILKAGTLMYLNKAVLRHLRGTQVEVASDYYSDDDEVSVRCCSGERIKQRFSVDFKDLVKENPKKQSSSAKPKFKKGDYVYWLKNPEEVRYGKKAVVNYDRVDKIIGTEKDIHGTLRYKTEEVLLSGGNPRKGVAYESYLVLAD